jgi:trigger factor
VSRFKDQIGDQVKGKVLVDAVSQVSDEHDFSAISEPDFDFDAVKLPDDGPMTFEFDLEVRPEFDLPDWKGLTLDKPTREIDEEDIDRHLARLLRGYATLAVKEGPAELGDSVTLNMCFTHDGKTLSTVEDRTLSLKASLSFRNAQFDGFGELLTGCVAGDKREATIKISDEAEIEDLQGKEVQAEFEVVQVNEQKLPELTSSFLEEIGGFVDEDDLRGAVKEELERQFKYRQQQQIRGQITGQLTATADWDLPPELLRRQAHRELQRMVLELQSSGFSQDVIKQHENQLRQNSLAHTATALKEHFILERIAEEEGVDAEPSDFDDEIELIAEQSGYPPRRVRARLEKRGEMDSLRNQIIERKVIERITAHAAVKETEMEPPADDVTAIDVAIGGEQEASEIPEAKHGEEAKSLPGQPDRG